MISSIRFYRIALCCTLMASCQADSPKFGGSYLQWDREKLLTSFGLQFIYPTEMYVWRSQVKEVSETVSRPFEEVANALVGPAVGCEVRHLGEVGTDNELRALWLLWGESNGRNKNDVIAQYGEATYTSAIAIFVDAHSLCKPDFDTYVKKALSRQ